MHKDTKYVVNCHNRRILLILFKFDHKFINYTSTSECFSFSFFNHKFFSCNKHQKLTSKYTRKLIKKKLYRQQNLNSIKRCYEVTAAATTTRAKTVIKKEKNMRKTYKDIKVQ